MRILSLLAAAAVGLTLGTPASVLGQHCPPGGCCPQPGCCPPNFKIVEEICYKNVIRKTSVPVPDVKKVVHWRYDNRPEDFAVPCCTCPRCNCNSGCKDCGDCNACVQCGRPCCRAPLIKRMVVEEVPITKCVVECHVEKVACVTYRRVPCGASPGGVITSPNEVVVPPGQLVPEPLPVMPPAQAAVPLPAPAFPAELVPEPRPAGELH